MRVRLSGSSSGRATFASLCSFSGDGFKADTSLLRRADNVSIRSMLSALSRLRISLSVAVQSRRNLPAKTVRIPFSLAFGDFSNAGTYTEIMFNEVWSNWT